MFESLLSTAKSKFDLTLPEDQASLYQLTAQVAQLEGGDLATLKEIARKSDTPLEFKLAVKLVESRRYVETIKKPLKLAVVFAMWGEQNRLRPKSAENPNGEDALRVKLDQLNWLFDGSPVDWQVFPVDDGDPNRSGDIAQEIADAHPLGTRVSVCYLANEIPVATGPLRTLDDVNDSRKGGAIILGCMKALENGADVVIYTDADNSVHLGQTGILLRAYLEDGFRVVLGNRRHPDSILVKQEGRWGIGIKVLRHMQRMVGQAIFSGEFRDTQAAFKLFEARVLAEILNRRTVFDFSFDTDWIFATIAMGVPYSTVPFAFIDSFAESASITQGPMTTWERLLKGLVIQVRAHGIPHNEAMAKLIDEEIQTSSDLDLIINHLPQELDDATQDDFGNPDVMSPEALQAWIQERKKEAL